MSIEYTYEIVRVDPVARVMEVAYSADGHQTMNVGARLPFEGEALEDVIKMYAPVPLWIELATPVSVPQVGTAGTVTPSQPVIEEAPLLEIVISPVQV
jgi:hypothetical protein